MADVKVHKCFPTIIYEFDYEPIDKHLMQTYITQVRKNHKYHTADDLHMLSYFARLRDIVKEVSNDYLFWKGTSFKERSSINDFSANVFAIFPGILCL